ncbi:EAL domain-containing protein [Nodosilinea sp. PGN35]|uniref:EAL domain-containing protein n=1 Tax=Nodosilinea sp. PGN35 TaxID=3020489 RepID=UPI0023B2834C|nr:EAL domain-containing protein [Nodosilinea sp. TSF1-S3]MDF0369057.1 EAL domain-containing protein [Nodosilinea sp. TSF1-S3]
MPGSLVHSRPDDDLLEPYRLTAPSAPAPTSHLPLGLGRLGLWALGLGAAVTLPSVLGLTRRCLKPSPRGRSQLKNHLRPLVEAANLTYWEIDLTSKTIWLFGDLTRPASPATDLRLTHAQFLSRFIPPEQVPELYQAFQAALETPGFFNLEHQIALPPGGDLRWVMARGQVLTDPLGQPHTVVGVAFDNTAKKRLELALSASEAQFKDILDNASVALSQLRAFADGSWHYAYFSAGHRRVYGFSDGDFFADPDLWHRRVHPEDLEAAIGPLKQSVAVPAQTASVALRFQHPNGSWRYIAQHYSSRRDEANDCWVVVIVSQDITETQQTELDLRASEARFSRLADNLPGVVYRYEQNPATGHHAFTYMSAGARSLYELEPEAMLNDITLACQVICPEDIAGLTAAIAESAQNLAPFEWRGRFVTASGTIKWVQSIANPERQADGTIVWDGLLFDISERARFEAERKSANLALSGERDLLESVMTTSVAAITVLAPDGQILFANSRAERVLGLTLSDITRRTYNSPEWRATNLDGSPRADEQQPFNMVLTTGEPVYDIRHAIEWPNGQRRVLSINGAPVKGSDGQIVRLVFSISDITDQLEAETALRASEAQLRLITENMSDLVCLHEPDGTLIYVSPSCQVILGYTPDEMIGQSPYQFFHPDDADWIEQGAHRDVLAGTVVPAAYRMRQRSGTYIWLETLTKPIFNEAHQVIGIQTTSRNITDKVEIQAQLEYDAGHDALTGLPNRTLLLQRLDAAIGQQHLQPCAVLFIDLDRFKVINDSLGHHIGDELLVAIAQKLCTTTRPEDLPARLSGDEFVVLLNGIAGVEQAIQVAERLLAEVRQPFALKDRDVFVSASIGIALCTPRHQTGADLLRDADIAMYRAKAGGKGRYALFDPQMHLQVLREMHLEETLRRALEHQELTLYYQPIVNLSNGQIKGFEVLARWPHSEYGMISPAEFIPIAEETGLIIPLGRWVLRTACSQFSRWRQRFPAVRAMGLSVNLSAVQLRDAAVVADIATLLTELNLPSDCLTLEITESLLIENVDHNLAVLQHIKSHGIRLSIDDFGTGYSSLSYLQRFPFSGLKVDRSFVTYLGTKAENPVLIKSILALADSLELDPVAEGIETEKQLEFLQANGCRYGQGFFFYRPMAAAQVEALLAEGPAPKTGGLGG